MKKCINCKTEKEKSEFYQRMGWCKICHNERMKKWQKEHPENAKKAWTKFNRKRNKGRICPKCGNIFKISTSQTGCSLKCRFDLSYEKKESNCWEWTQYLSGSGYAALWVNGKHRLGSHISYEIHKGEIEKGLMVLHTCDNPICVNPDHLYLGNHQQNMDDMNSRGRGNKNRWHFRKYSREKCMEIIRLKNLGKIYKEISYLTDVGESACKYICKNLHRLQIGVATI
jgi:hypothetical protein